jgi:hypothetical protein
LKLEDRAQLVGIAQQGGHGWATGGVVRAGRAAHHRGLSSRPRPRHMGIIMCLPC